MNKYDDLEKTQDLFFIDDVPTPIESLEMEGALKETFSDKKLEEITPPSNIEESLKKEKKSIKDKWASLSKKKKIIIISSIVVFLILIIILVIFLCTRKKDENVPKKPEAPIQIVDKDSYIYRDGTLIFLNDKEEEIGSYTCENKNEKLCYVVNYAEDNFDEARNVYQNGDKISRLSVVYLEKYVFISDSSKENDGNIAIYNIKTNEKEKGIYSLVKGDKNSNLVILKNDKDKYGAISFSSDEYKTVLDFTFDYLGKMMDEENIVAKTSDKYYLYNEEGKLLSKGLPYEIKSYNDKYIVTSDNNKYSVYDFKGNLVTDEAYEYIKLENDFMALVKDKLLYLRDYSNNKYYEDGIKLDNKDYVPENVYDDNKVLIETKQSFSFTREDNRIDITYYTKTKEKVKQVNLNDLKISNNYSYLNYFDGSLYFYEDKEETKIIGKYECNNKNNGDILDTCNVARESVFNTSKVDESTNRLPIINKRYVFIYDALNSKNPNVVLYDLVDNKALIKYKEVDTGIYKNSDNPFMEVNELKIIAINKNGKYGVITLDKDGAHGLIGFNYDKIERWNNNYLAYDGKYLIIGKEGLDSQGEGLTEKYDKKIVNYNGKYVVTEDNNKYSIYDVKGEKINNNEFKHIELRDKYYIVIDSNNIINMYKFDDPDFKLKDIKINEETLEEEVIDANISVSGGNVSNSYVLSDETLDGFMLIMKDNNKKYHIDKNGFVTLQE